MSLANAMAFIARVRRDPALRQRLAALDPQWVSREAYCGLAEQVGLPCTPAEFGEAFRLDWLARWTHFARAARLQETAGS